MEHLALGVFLSRPLDGCYMAMFTAYLDASGTQAEGDVVVAVGSVALVDNWTTFDREWADTLHGLGLNTFHMKDVAHRWKRSEDDRRSLIQGLIGHADKAITRIFAAAFTLKDYPSVNAEYCCDEELGGPYALAVYASMARSVKWLLDNMQPSDHFKLFIEEGDTGQTSLNRILRRAGLDSAHYLIIPKREDGSQAEYRAFHIADFVGYEMRVEMERRRQAKREHGMRGSLRGMLEVLGPRLDAITLDSSRLRDACEIIGVAKRG